MHRIQVLLFIIGFNLLSTWLHYTDNAIHVDRYPEPEWFTTIGVFITIAIMTPIGLLGYWLYRQNRFVLSYIVLGIYSITSISSPGHYLFPGVMAMTAKMHALIWLDALAGSLLIGFMLWSITIAQEWKMSRSPHG
jgi:hypothetical protein